MFSLESPYRCDSDEYTQYTIFNNKKKITLNYPKSAAIGVFPRDSKMSSKQFRIVVLLFSLQHIMSLLKIKKKSEAFTKTL